jgi:hypothetical protein
MVGASSSCLLVLYLLSGGLDLARFLFGIPLRGTAKRDGRTASRQHFRHPPAAGRLIVARRSRLKPSAACGVSNIPPLWARSWGTGKQGGKTLFGLSTAFLCHLGASYDGYADIADGLAVPESPTVIVTLLAVFATVQGEKEEAQCTAAYT